MLLHKSYAPHRMTSYHTKSDLVQIIWFIFITDLCLTKFHLIVTISPQCKTFIFFITYLYLFLLNIHRSIVAQCLKMSSQFSEKQHYIFSVCLNVKRFFKRSQNVQCQFTTTFCLFVCSFPYFVLALFSFKTFELFLLLFLLFLSDFLCFPA